MIVIDVDVGQILVYCSIISFQIIIHTFIKTRNISKPQNGVLKFSVMKHLFPWRDASMVYKKKHHREQAWCISDILLSGWKT